MAYKELGYFAIANLFWGATSSTSFIPKGPERTLDAHELTGHTHTSRVLFMTQTPDGCTVATAAADEAVRTWNVFGIMGFESCYLLYPPSHIISCIHQYLSM
ncbi:hypothetical protein CerSpe_246780 [Prunus speciosa]